MTNYIREQKLQKVDNMSRNFSKEDIDMDNKSRKLPLAKTATSQVIIKNARRHYFITLKMPNIQLNIDTNKCWHKNNCEKLKYSHTYEDSSMVLSL